MSITQRFVHPALLVAGLLLLPNQAEAQEQPWAVRVAVASGRSLSHGTLGDPGIGLGLEYRASRQVGVELQAVRTEVLSRLDFGFVCALSCNPEAGFDLTAASVRLNWHLTPDRAVDLRVAPLLAHVAFDDFGLRLPGATTIPLEDEVAWGLNMGLDASFGERRWFATADLTYLDSRLRIVDLEDDEGSMQALLLSLGVGFRF